MNSLTSMNAVITGASAPNGIGRASAIELAKCGANVIVTDLGGSTRIDGKTVNRIDLLESLARELRGMGVRAMAVEVDITDEAQIRNCVALVRAEFESLDVLVNNAGTIVGAAPFLETTPDQWRLSFDVNLFGTMLFCRAAIPEMKLAGGGSIINVGSTGSLGAEPGFGAYTAMKHGLMGLTKTIAAEFGEDGIRCNIVCPGYTDTDMHMAANERLSKEQGRPLSDIKEDRYEAVALRRSATPAEVGRSIAFLAGPNASYVTGVALPVAGGVPAGI